jgi:hypothetical protein
MSSLPKSPALRALYWRSEILRVMYWLRGEGLGDLVDVGMVCNYLEVGPRECAAQLEGLVGDGHVVRDGSWYALSARGLAEGEAELATAFADLARPTSGECSDECWCQISADEHEACSGRGSGLGTQPGAVP